MLGAEVVQEGLLVTGLVVNSTQKTPYSVRHVDCDNDEDSGEGENNCVEVMYKRSDETEIRYLANSCDTD